MAAAAGVDDVHLIAALALHRRMTEDELRHAVGDRVYDAFAPHGAALQPRRRGSRQPGLARRRPSKGEEVEINKRAAESDLIVYVNINIVVDGRRLEVHRHRPVQLPRHPPPPQRRTPCSTSKSLHGPHTTRELHSHELAHGQGASRDAGVKVFQIETTINNDVFGTDGPMSRAAEARVGVDARDRAVVHRHAEGPRPSCRATPGARSSRRWQAPHGMTSVQAGEVEAVHESTTATASSSTSCRSRARPTS